MVCLCFSCWFRAGLSLAVISAAILVHHDSVPSLALISQCLSMRSWQTTWLMSIHSPPPPNHEPGSSDTLNLVKLVADQHSQCARMRVDSEVQIQFTLIQACVSHFLVLNWCWPCNRTSHHPPANMCLFCIIVVSLPACPIACRLAYDRQLWTYPISFCPLRHDLQPITPPNLQSPQPPGSPIFSSPIL